MTFLRLHLIDVRFRKGNIKMISELFSVEFQVISFLRRAFCRLCKIRASINFSKEATLVTGSYLHSTGRS